MPFCGLLYLNELKLFNGSLFAGGKKDSEWQLMDDPQKIPDITSSAL